MSYSLLILPNAERDCEALPKNVYSRCSKAILSLKTHPRPIGCQKLKGEDAYRIRVGDYRILYRIDDAQKRVYIYRVKHRKEVYR